MTRLECSSKDEALRSLACVVGISVEEVQSIIEEYPPSLLNDEVKAEDRPHEDVLTKHVLGQWPEDVPVPDETVWFHGSRLHKATDFTEGLLPLRECLPRLETMVESLAQEVGVYARG